MVKAPSKSILFNEEIFGDIARNIFKNVKENFICLITSGSIQLGQALPGWSDLDFIVVVKNLNFATKIKLNKLFKDIERYYRIKVGGVAVSIDELIKPEILIQRLEGKVLQSLLELQRGRQKLYFLKRNFKCPFCLILNKKQIKAFTLNEIGRIFALYRRLILRSDLQSKDGLVRLLKQSISYSIIITKLAIQYFSGITCCSDKLILEQAIKMFPKKLVKQFKKILIFKAKWPGSNKIKDQLNEVDQYLESFLFYVFKRVENKV
ncbi:MAG: nucleotidyltransferase domain-containing protein [Patescibacteria group bacterium]